VLLLSGVDWALDGVSVDCSGGRAEQRGEQGRGMSRRRKVELFDGALLLKLHEAVVEGGVVVEMVGRNSGWRCRGHGQGGGHCCLKALGTAWVPLFGPWDWWVGPTRFWIFSNLSKTGSTLKIQNGCLGYYEQCSQLCRHLVPNINRAKNPGPDLTFESLMNFKRDLNLLEKSDKFSKILSWLDLHKSEFS
jgi:hypothetical protein